jgi:hypothetical protein
MPKSLPAYSVRVADRETGQESTLRISAADETAATAAALEKGWLVVAVRLIPPSESDSNEPRQTDRARWVRRVSAEPLGLRMLGLGQIILAIAIGFTSRDATERTFAFGLWVTGAIFFAAGSCARYIIFAIVGPDARK